MNFLRRMGSASSTSSKVSSLKSENKEEQKYVAAIEKRSSIMTKSESAVIDLRDTVTNTPGRTTLSSQSTENILRQDIEKLQEKVKSLRAANESLELENSMLQDRLQLEADVDGRLMIHSTSNMELHQTVALKEDEINSINSQLESIRDKSEQMKLRYKSKLKSIKDSYHQQKQDTSLKMFELKDEIRQLSAANAELQQRLNDSDVHSESQRAGNSYTKAAGIDNKSDIIIELSTQISEQETRLQHLQSELEDRDALIAKLTTASQSSAQSIIQLEAEKASEEVQLLAKELKKKMKKRRVAKPVNMPCREESSLSKDSGAEDLHSTHLSSSTGCLPTDYPGPDSCLV